MKLTREKVIEAILAIQTPEDVTDARRLRNQYLREHPCNEVVWGASGGLEKCAEAFGMPFEPMDLEKP